MSMENLTLSRNTSLFVIFLTAVNVSCTIPMTGLLDCGVMIILGTDASCDISALVSSDWAKCKFISSPSKSALYGVVTLKQPSGRVLIEEIIKIQHLHNNLSVT